MNKKQGCSGWSAVHGKVNQHADDFFYRLGHRVAVRPKATLTLSLAFVVACCFGFANFQIESDAYDLWVPRDTLALEQEDIVYDYFDSTPSYAVLLLVSPSGDGNILTKTALDAMWELDGMVGQIATDSGNTFDDLCLLEVDGVTCEQSARSITKFWGNSFETYKANVASDADVLAYINVAIFPDGEPVSLEAIFGNSLTYDAEGNVSGASAMTKVWELREDKSTENREWMALFQDSLGDEQEEYEDVVSVKYSSSRAIDDALEASVTGEVYLFAFTYIIMTLFVTIALGRCCSGLVRSRTYLGIAGVVLVVTSGLAAYGLNSAFGVPFTTLSQLLPFVLIGIGVDDMFVIVAAFDHTDPALPVEERVALGLKRCGVSLTYTSLTNFTAFMLGSMSALPALEYFCFYAGAAVLVDFALQVTAFVAVLTMDANRQRAGKMDWCCCFKAPRSSDDVTIADHENKVQRGIEFCSLLTTSRTEAIDPNRCDSAESETKSQTRSPQPALAEAGQPRLSFVGRFMREKYAPSLLSAPGRVLVLLGSTLLLGAGIYGVTQVKQGLDVVDLAPDGHFAREYALTSRSYDLDVQEQYIPLGIYTLDVDYQDVSVQAQIQKTDDEIVALEYTGGPVDSWLTSFVAWAANNTEFSTNVGESGGYPVYDDQDSFYGALSNFTADGENVRFSSDIVFDDNNKIEISRSELYLLGLTTTSKFVDVLLNIRDTVGDSTLDPQPFGFTELFILTEQYLIIYSELIFNFCLALVAVAVLSLLVLGKVPVTVTVCLAVVMIDVELLGFVYHWGLEVNGITVIELIMAVGLVVDYMVHVVHYILHQNPRLGKHTRIANSLGEIGPSVMLGAATTFLGIVPLAFANNEVFRVFFKMFLIIITFGFFYGIVFVPVALSLLPDSFSSWPAHPAGTGPQKDEDGQMSPAAAHEQLSPTTAHLRWSPTAAHAQVSSAAADRQMSPTAADGQMSPIAAPAQLSPTAADRQMSPTAAADEQLSPTATDGQLSPTATDGQISPTATDGQISSTATDGQIPPTAADEQFSPTAGCVCSGGGFWQ